MESQKSNNNLNEREGEGDSRYEEGGGTEKQNWEKALLCKNLRQCARHAGRIRGAAFLGGVKAGK